MADSRNLSEVRLDLNGLPNDRRDFCGLLPYETLAKLYYYKAALVHGILTPGKYFKNKIQEEIALNKNQKKATKVSTDEIKQFLQQCTIEDFFILLEKTKKPVIFAESAVSFNPEKDWSPLEASILGDFSSPVAVTIYDQGIHREIIKHDKPFSGILLYACGPLLKKKLLANDPPELMEINDDQKSTQLSKEVLGRFYVLFERRLLINLVAANDISQANGKKAFITTATLGGGFFAGDYVGKMGDIFKQALINILNKHGSKLLSNIAGIYFDPYNECKQETHLIHNTLLMVRPFLLGNKQVAAIPQLCPPSTYNQVYENQSYDFSKCLFFSLVAWDHFSKPGNDNNKNSRVSDDGVKSNATNTAEVIFNIKGHHHNKKGFIPRENNRTFEEIFIEDKKTIDYSNRIIVMNQHNQLIALHTMTQDEQLYFPTKEQIAKLEIDNIITLNAENLEAASICFPLSFKQRPTDVMSIDDALVNSGEENEVDSTRPHHQSISTPIRIPKNITGIREGLGFCTVAKFDNNVTFEKLPFIEIDNQNNKPIIKLFVRETEENILIAWRTLLNNNYDPQSISLNKLSQPITIEISQNRILGIFSKNKKCSHVLKIEGFANIFNYMFKECGLGMRFFSGCIVEDVYGKKPLLELKSKEDFALVIDFIMNEIKFLSKKLLEDSKKYKLDNNEIGFLHACKEENSFEQIVFLINKFISTRHINDKSSISIFIKIFIEPCNKILINQKLLQPTRLTPKA